MSELPKSDLAYWKAGERVMHRGEIRVVTKPLGKSLPFVTLLRIDDGVVSNEAVDGEKLERVLE